MSKRRPVMLVVLDGWGWREDPADNAVLQANAMRHRHCKMSDSTASTSPSQKSF